MKIFIVCPRLCFGGAEHVATMLANGLSNIGHEVVIVSNLYEDITYEIDERIKLLNLVIQTKNKGLKFFLSFMLLRKYVRIYKPNVVIGINYSSSFLSRFACLGRNIHVIATEHDSFERPDSAQFNLWNKIHKFYLNKIYKHITVLTEADKRVIGKRFQNVTVMPNPLSLIPSETIPPKDNIILAAGRIDAWHYKGFDILIKAWGRIANRYPDWRLQIAGKDANGSLTYLEKLCVENNVKKSVDFLGFRKDMDSLYKQSSVFVLSSRYEGFGLVLVEAMSQGCACVAADYKGRQSEIIKNNHEGIVCQTEDVKALAQSIEKMLIDTTYRTEVQENAIKRSRFYTIENIAKIWNTYLNNILQEKL